jgi:hypothetical protein
VTTGFDANQPQAVFFKLPCLKLFDHDKIVYLHSVDTPFRGAGWPTAIVPGGTMAALKAGETAPDFELPGVTGKQRQKFKLSDLRGKKNVVLAFYPLDWSPT